MNNFDLNACPTPEELSNLIDAYAQTVLAQHQKTNHEACISCAVTNVIAADSSIQAMFMSATADLILHGSMAIQKAIAATFVMGQMWQAMKTNSSQTACTPADEIAWLENLLKKSIDTDEKR